MDTMYMDYNTLPVTVNEWHSLFWRQLRDQSQEHFHAQIRPILAHTMEMATLHIDVLTTSLALAAFSEILTCHSEKKKTRTVCWMTLQSQDHIGQWPVTVLISQIHHRSARQWLVFSHWCA